MSVTLTQTYIHTDLMEVINPDKLHTYIFNEGMCIAVRCRRQVSAYVYVAAAAQTSLDLLHSSNRPLRNFLWRPWTTGVSQTPPCHSAAAHIGLGFITVYSRLRMHLQ